MPEISHVHGWGDTTVSDGIMGQTTKLPMNIGVQLQEKRETILATAAKYGAFRSQHCMII